jgi:predicted DNA binding CopG/RHH family protein
MGVSKRKIGDLIAEDMESRDIPQAKIQAENSTSESVAGKTKAVLVRLAPQEYARLKAIAKQRGMGSATILRELLMEYLNTYRI